MPILCLLFCFAPEASSQWEYIGPDSTSNVLSLVVDTSLGAVPTLFAGTTTGLYESTDDGSTWQPVGFQNKVVYALALHGTYLFAGVERSGVYQTLADSISWVPMNSGIATKSVLALAVVPNNNGGAVMVAGLNGGVFRSTNYGVDWLATSLTTGNGVEFAYWQDRQSDSTIYTATTLTADSSIDGGATWGVLAIGGLAAITVLHDRQGNAIFIEGAGPCIYADLPVVGTTEVDYGILNNNNLASLAVIDSNLYAGATGSIYLTTDEVRWKAIGDSLPASPVGVIVADKSSLLAATQGNGIWKRPFSDFIVTSVKQPARGLPTEYTLSQNYPNPFNPTTAIRYALPSQGYITLVVYNMLGERIATLVDGMQTPGAKSVNFNAGSLASGVYFYRLQAGSYSATKKLILIK